MNLVFDTNVLISSTLWDKSSAHRLLLKLIESKSIIFSSKEILAEYRYVLVRDFNLSEETIALHLEKIYSFITLVEPVETIHVIKEDPDDNKILECAVASSSQYIITYDNHLLKLKEFQGIKIVKPEEALGL